jgi:hypothetical protein
VCGIGNDLLDNTKFDTGGEALMNQLMGCYKSVQKSYLDFTWMLKVTKQMWKFSQVLGDEVSSLPHHQLKI